MSDLATWDPITTARVLALHPAIRVAAARVIRTAFADGLALRVTSGLRTLDEQARLYAIGRSAPGAKVTNARPGQSYHNFGLAFDVVAMDGAGAPVWTCDWDRIGRIGKSFGFAWGGDWRYPDRPHFENGYGCTCGQLLAALEAGKLHRGYVILSEALTWSA